jgi:iron(III) transport system substrate-binding protein
VDANRGGRYWLVLILGGTLAVMLVSLLLSPAGCGGGEGRVSLYCAQDEEFAEASLAEFKKRTGLQVDTKFDTEKNKSVSLAIELFAEKNRPRCDVFWNNEFVHTIRLQRAGMLEPYDSPSGKPYPDRYKAADHTWYAFADRARVLIVNTDLVKPEDRPKSLLDLTDARWKGQVVMAKPIYGTSATQGACLFSVLGADKAKEYYLALKANGVQIAPGNKQVAEWVGAGHTEEGHKVAVGVTDTDDALEELEAHPKSVVMIFPDRDRKKDEKMGTLFIPNTLCILKGSPNPTGARKLVDYLLSAEVEGRLAESASHQIPLNPEVKPKLPKEMETPATVKAMDVDYDKAAKAWDEAYEFLTKEFAEAP